MNQPENPTREYLAAPVKKVGAAAWLKDNLFNSWYNSLLTVLTLLALGYIVPPFFKWAFIDSLWNSSADACRDIEGACWSIVPQNIKFIILGFFPEGQEWRPILAMILLLALVIYSKEKSRWNKLLAWMWPVGLIIMGTLMYGGIFGMPVVETDQWSGLPLTMMLSFFGMVMAYPLGVLLALGRQSKMPAIKTLCVVYIEMIRGVPLISLLFMSSIMFPLFLPDGMTIDKVLRAQVAIILFTAAYIAEVVRGGLQAMPRGQYEAADSLGLTYSQTMRLIILPQALKIVIPPTVGILLSAFKDTSLVVIIALYDVLKTTKVTLQNPQWTGYSTEAYVFLAVLYFICCYAMSSYSRRLEKELHTGH
ncbi:general L-amino acid transport system permease protein [Malonomonas rubra DSM 5091]|uniref:General L-amino acid transport system permease protein n=1 Tax=Malonomonas rubra DSM 5091 TaxID=1122189 RepID=A0A1M6JAJ8_MALRU|nr:amino acid ABC transporter permease [Malonomonas rubra]SHJ43726.1 general L-amino acid transport system permease protein [Malonomonas rubra DSM 5091]